MSNQRAEGFARDIERCAAWCVTTVLGVSFGGVANESLHPFFLGAKKAKTRSTVVAMLRPSCGSTRGAGTAVGGYGAFDLCDGGLPSATMTAT